MHKVGIGYDIHGFSDGKKLFLGGIEIPFEKGLNGHSDADVLLHAICDAILGALGLGDIGDFFPDTDPQYKNIASSILVEKVIGLMQKEDHEIENIDCIIHAEEPKLGAYKAKIKKKVASLLKMEEKKVSIKAKTNEHFDAVGQKKAIAAYAVVLLTNE